MNNYGNEPAPALACAVEAPAAVPSVTASAEAAPALPSCQLRLPTLSAATSGASPGKRRQARVRAQEFIVAGRDRACAYSGGASADS